MPLKDQLNEQTPSNDVLFDPTTEWANILSEIGKDSKAAGISWDEWIKRRNQAMDKLYERLSEKKYFPYFEMSNRLRAVKTAEWGMEEIQFTNSKHFSGFEISEMINPKDLIEYIARFESSHDDLNREKQNGTVDQRWISIDVIDALCVSSGISALCAKEKIGFGRKSVDLGGGDGTWGYIMALTGFDATLIERNPTLAEVCNQVKEELVRMNARVGQVTVIPEEFHTKKEENSPAIIEAIGNADIVTCYPWPDEVEDRIKLFCSCTKPEALLVMYGSGMDGFSIPLPLLKKYDLEQVGLDPEDKERVESDPLAKNLYGFPAATFGSNWVLLRKK